MAEYIKNRWEIYFYDYDMPHTECMVFDTLSDAINEGDRMSNERQLYVYLYLKDAWENKVIKWWA